MSGFNEFSNIKSKQKQRFTNYDQLVTYLTSQGTSFKRSIPLYTIGSDGNDSNIIGHLAYNSAGSIAPCGEINLGIVTDGGFGIINSVDGPTTITLTAGHTLPATFNGMAWDVSAVSESFYNFQAGVSTNTLTMPDTTGLAAGDCIYGVGRSEFSIGNSTRNFCIDSGSIRIESGLKVNNASAFHCLCNGFSQKYWVLRTECTKSDSSPTNNSAVGPVAWWSTSKCIGTVWRRISGADASKIALGTLTNPTFTAPTLDVPQSGTLSKLILTRHNWNLSTPLVNGAILASTTDGMACLSDASTYTSPIGWGALSKPGGAEIITITFTLLQVG